MVVESKKSCYKPHQLRSRPLRCIVLPIIGTFLFIAYWFILCPLLYIGLCKMPHNWTHLWHFYFWIASFLVFVMILSVIVFLWRTKCRACSGSGEQQQIKETEMRTIPFDEQPDKLVEDAEHKTKVHFQDEIQNAVDHKNAINRGDEVHVCEEHLKTIEDDKVHKKLSKPTALTLVNDEANVQIHSPAHPLTPREAFFWDLIQSANRSDSLGKVLPPVLTHKDRPVSEEDQRFTNNERSRGSEPIEIYKATNPRYLEVHPNVEDGDYLDDKISGESDVENSSEDDYFVDSEPVDSNGVYDVMDTKPGVDGLSSRVAGTRPVDGEKTSKYISHKLDDLRSSGLVDGKPIRDIGHEVLEHRGVSNIVDDLSSRVAGTRPVDGEKTSRYISDKLDDLRSSGLVDGRPISHEILRQRGVSHIVDDLSSRVVDTRPVDGDKTSRYISDKLDDLRLSGLIDAKPISGLGHAVLGQKGVSNIVDDLSSRVVATRPVDGEKILKYIPDKVEDVQSTRFVISDAILTEREVSTVVDDSSSGPRDGHKAMKLISDDVDDHGDAILTQRDSTVVDDSLSRPMDSDQVMRHISNTVDGPQLTRLAGTKPVDDHGDPVLTKRDVSTVVDDSPIDGGKTMRYISDNVDDLQSPRLVTIKSIDDHGDEILTQRDISHIVDESSSGLVGAKPIEDDKATRYISDNVHDLRTPRLVGAHPIDYDDAILTQRDLSTVPSRFVRTRPMDGDKTVGYISDNVGDRLVSMKPIDDPILTQKDIVDGSSPHLLDTRPRNLMETDTSEDSQPICLVATEPMDIPQKYEAVGSSCLRYHVDRPEVHAGSSIPVESHDREYFIADVSKRKSLTNEVYMYIDGGKDQKYLRIRDEDLKPSSV